jgi:hypothetical protein
MEVVNNTNPDFDNYQKAKKKVESIKGFYGHLFPYITVNLVLLFINLKYSPQNLWFFWPLLGWGLSVVMHGLVVFDCVPFFNKEWEQKKIQRFIEEEKTKHNKYE